MLRSLQVGRNPAELTDANRFATPEMIENYLLDILVPTLISGGELAPHKMSGAARRATNDDDARRYLAFLAAHLTDLGTSDFAWWELHRALHPITPRLVIGLAVGLFSGLLAEIVSGPPTGLLIGICAGIIAAFLSSSTASPPGYASFRKRSWKRLSPRRFTEQVAGGLLAGVALGIFAVYKGGNVPGPLGLVVTGSVTRAFSTGLVAGLAGGAVIGVVELLRSPAETDAPTSPSSTFSSDRRLTLIAGLVITSIGSIFSGLLYGLATGLLFGIAAGLATVVIAGIGGAFVGRKLTVRAWPMFIVTIIVLRTRQNTPLGTYEIS